MFPTLFPNRFFNALASIVLAVLVYAVVIFVLGLLGIVLSALIITCFKVLLVIYVIAAVFSLLF